MPTWSIGSLGTLKQVFVLICLGVLRTFGETSHMGPHDKFNLPRSCFSPYKTTLSGSCSLLVKTVHRIATVSSS